MLQCDKCGAAISSGAKFCSQCGDPVTEEDILHSLSHETCVANVEIIFGYSASSNYDKAVEICSKIPSYSVIGEERNSKHRVLLPMTEIDLITNLFELVGSWKSSKMLINGRASTKKDIVYRGVGCFKNRQKAFNIEQFCFGEREYEANIWGCKKLNMPVSIWGGGWLDYGAFDRSGVWHFDKARICHDLELGLKENELCPVLDRKRVFETLENFPSSIDPKFDKNWEYRTSYQEINGEYQEVAVGIKPVINRFNGYVIGSYKPVWNDSVQGDEDLTVCTVTNFQDRGQELSGKQIGGGGGDLISDS